MTLPPPIFPTAEDDGCEPFRAIGNRLGIDEWQAMDAFRGLDLPEWSSAEHFKAIKNCIDALNKSAILARELVISLYYLPQPELAQFLYNGLVSPYQIEKLAVALEGEYKDLDNWRRARQTGGRSNPDADIVAEGMRRLFRRLRKPITFGQKDSGGGPSTEFGREVEFALAAFGIRANWRRATEKARAKHEAIQNRRMRCIMAKHERNRPPNTNQKNE